MAAIPQDVAQYHLRRLEDSPTAAEHISNLLESDPAREAEREKLRKSERDNSNLRVVISEMSARLAEVESLTKSLYATRVAYQSTKMKYEAVAKILVAAADVFKHVESEIVAVREDIEKELPAWKNGVKNLLHLLDITSKEVQTVLDAVGSDVEDPTKPKMHYRLIPYALALSESQDREKKLEIELAECKKRERVLEEKLANCSKQQTASADQPASKADLERAYLNGARWAFDHGTKMIEEFKALFAGMADPLNRQ